MKFEHVESWTLNLAVCRVSPGFLMQGSNRAINVKTFTFDGWESDQKVGVLGS